MVRPPMFSSSVYARHGQTFDKPNSSAPIPVARRLTAGGIAVLVLLVITMLFLSALIGVVAGLAPVII